MSPLPPDFLWGTATSAHQVEGNNFNNDWWSFVTAHKSGSAAAFTEHFSADLDAARAMGTNAFRFSLEWSRVEPGEGERDDAAVAYYDALVDACIERRLEPMLTLVHFTLPQWARDVGGWRSSRVQVAFRRHVRWVVDRYGDRVRWFVTFNEPNVQASAGYVAGVFPPGKRLRFLQADRVLLAILRAHADAYRIIHAHSDEHHVGISPHVIDWTPSRGDVGGVFTRMAETFNWAVLDALHTGRVKLTTLRRDEPNLCGTLDFVGVNYFMSQPRNLRGALQFAGLLSPPSSTAASDMGWPVDAEGLHRVLTELGRRWACPLHQAGGAPGRPAGGAPRPIVITENGVADALDAVRREYLAQHVDAVARAVRDGVNVRGYFHWSLIDNFEWHEGFAPRFGLLEVDYATQQRTPRPSAGLYRKIIRDHTTHVVEEDAA